MSTTFKTAFTTDFQQGVATGELKTMTLVEAKDLINGEFVEVGDKFKGVKSDIVSMTVLNLKIKNRVGVVDLSFRGNWELVGHRLTITDEKSVRVYVVNPLF